MAEDIKISKEQLDALDQVINAVRKKELTPDEISSALAAPVNNQNNGGAITDIISLVTGFTLVTVTALTLIGFRVTPEMSAEQIAEIKKEATLKQLLDLRNSAVANKKGK